MYLFPFLECQQTETSTPIQAPAGQSRAAQCPTSVGLPVAAQCTQRFAGCSAIESRKEG